jgi:radical SAM protein with 4Fe4S-binding SPASM domain
MRLELNRVQIHLTNKCNLSCAFCDIPKRKWKTDLSQKKLWSITQELCRLGPRELTISGGGEPLLRGKLLLKMIKALKLAGIRVGIITNGTLISRELARGIVPHCDDFRISLHSTTIKQDEFLRGVRGSIRLSFRGIRWLAYWKRRMSREWPKIDIGFVITRYNIDCIPRLIEKVSALGADLITLRMVNEAMRDRKFYPFEWQMKKLEKDLPEYEKLAKHRGLDFRYDFRIEDVFFQTEKVGTPDTPLICHIPFRELVIFADGRASPCCNFIVADENSIAVDSVREKSVVEVWLGKKFNNFRKCVSKSKNLPRVCVECTPDFKSIEKDYREKLASN